MSATKSGRNATGRRNLPKTILIGIFRFALVDLDPEEAAKESCLGLCDETNLQILIRHDLPDVLYAEVLEHEIVHACWSSAKLADGCGEEAAVSALTPYLMMVRRDNPKIYAWIDKTIAKT